jgi:hypothetical protein
MLVLALLAPSPSVRVHAELTGHGHGALNGSYTVKDGRGDFLWTLVFFDTGPAGADVRIGNSMLFPLCVPCVSGQSGRTKLTKRGMRLLESGRASVVVTGVRGRLRGRIVTRH